MLTSLDLFDLIPNYPMLFLVPLVLFFLPFILECAMWVCHTFRAGPLSEALSLALLPSKPSWTKSSSRLTSSSSTICSAWRFAAMLPSAFITAKEQCLQKEEGTFMYEISSSTCVSVTAGYGSHSGSHKRIDTVFACWCSRWRKKNKRKTQLHWSLK